MMHTYRKALDVFEVGYWSPDTMVWTTLSTHETEKLAIKRVNALNGGSGNPAVWTG